MENQENEKKSFSIEELESMAKKYRYELIFSAMFVISCLFAYLFNIMGWALLLTAIGGVIGSLLPRHIEKYARYAFQFLFKQEKITQIVVGVVLLAFSVFLSPLIFLILGLLGGTELYHGMYRPMGE